MQASGPTQIVASIRERDIDLLLLDELHSSRPFRAWLLAKLKLPVQLADHLSNAWHGITFPDLGESDIVADFNAGDGGPLRLLIENKITAPFQDQQDIRYARRAREYIDSGECSACVTVLIAPQARMPTDRQFDRMISYEEIRQYFAAIVNPRSQFRCAVLDIAIERLRRNYVVRADEQMTRFWHEYWQVCSRHAPQLQMEWPETRGARSYWFYFTPTDLPDGMRLIHKAPEGAIDLQIPDWGNQIEALSDLLGPLLRPDMQIVAASRAAAVRVKTRGISFPKKFEAVQQDVLQAVQTAAALLDWTRTSLSEDLMRVLTG